MKHLIQHNMKNGNVQTGKNRRPIVGLLLLVFFIAGFSAGVNAQSTFNAVQDGAWNDPDTWDMAAVPTAADDVIIANGINVEVHSTGEACNTLLIGSGDGSGSGVIWFNGTSSLTVTGIITLGDINGATGMISMDPNATLTCSSIEEGDALYSGIYDTNMGTMVFNGTFTLPYNLFQFDNLVVNGGTLSTAGRNLPIEGDLTINDGATLDLGENTANRNSIAGTFTVNNGGTLRIGGGGTIPANFSTHVIGTTSTIEYYGVAQTVATLNSSQNYGNLIISGTGLKEVNGSIGIEGDLTINAAIFSVNVYTANRVTEGGTLTVANGATLRIAGSGTLPSNFSTHVIGASSTIEYSGTSSQNIATLNSSQKYGNLNVYSSVKTMMGDIDVAGTISFAGTPDKLIIGSNTLTLEGPISGSLSAARNFSGSTTSNLVIKGAYNRTLYFDAATNTLNDLTIDHNGNTTTMGNDLIVNNDLTFDGGKLAIAARTLTLKGNIVNNVSQGLKGGSTSKLVINGTVSPTLSMDQTTPGTTNVLSTLNINSDGQVVTMGNNLQMNSTLTFTAGKLAINGNTLTLKGQVTNTVAEGIRAGSTSNLVMNGTVSPSLSFDQTTPGTTNVINNFTVNSNSQTITLLNSLRLVGTHTPTAGVLASNGNYTIASTATGTANIAAGSTSGGYITGDVTVERYIPQNTQRAWRMLACPTNGQTIHQAWQENQPAGVDGNPGYGTNITTKEATWASDGFDFKTPNYSLYSYDGENDELIPVMSTTSSINNEPGYFMYIRGSRSVTPSSSIASVNSTTLRTTGTLNMGNQTGVSVSADKFAMVGNPFASAIDLRNVATSGGCTGASYYVWDPKLLGTYNLGAFQTFTPSGGNYIVIPGGGSYGASGSVCNTIQSGAAFLVQASGSAGTVTVNESSKTSGSSMVFRPGSSIADVNLIVNLFAVSGTDKILADGDMLMFNDDYSDGVDGLDSRKQSNFGENISILKNTNQLAIEKRPMPFANDTIRLATYGLKKTTYQLQLLGDRLQQDRLVAMLEDQYTHAITIINPDDTTYYSFSVDNNAASAALNRFNIVFKTATVLPVTFTSVKANEQADKTVAVSWTVNNQVNAKEYRIEKATDGRNFMEVGSVTAKNTNASQASYSWIDIHAAAGANYYRVKTLSNDGSYAYSQVVKLVLGHSLPVVSISPNPVEGGVMNLQLNMVKGTYSLQLFNAAGQVVYNGSLVHQGGTASQSISLPAGTGSGTYRLRVYAPGMADQTQTVIIK